MKMKKVLCTLLAGAMVVSMAACGGSSSSDETDVAITIFNSKSEIQSQFEEIAEEYSELTGVDVEVYYSNDTVAAHMATKYAANEPYTLSMVDAKDVYSLGAEHAADLSGEDWVEKTTHAITVDDKVLGFPVCVEARGVIYNGDAIKNITGKDFNPDDYVTLEAFKGLIEELKAGGMDSPVAIMKEDWSLAGHFLSETYEQQEDVDGFVDDLYAGNVELIKNDRWNSMMDYFDVMVENNYAKDAAIAAEREVSEQKIAEGEVAFMFGGNWDWAMINAYDYTENLGMMPVPQDMEGGAQGKLVGGGSKFFFIDNSESTTDEQRQAAKDFLNWLVFDERGNEFLTADCALVPAYSNIDAANLDPLGASVKKYADADALVGNYNYLPDDHYSVMGAEYQKYLDGQENRAELATAIENYWKSTTPVER